jgi:hypothetical protein
MLTWLKRFGVAAVVAAVTVVAIGAFTLTQSAAASSTATNTALAAEHGGRGGFCGEAGLAAAAEALDMTTEELSAQLWGGSTLSAIAEKAGVELQTVQDAVSAACQQAAKDNIEQAVTEGTLTREHADWLLEGLEKGFWGGTKGGFGFSPRGLNGAGGFGGGRGGGHGFFGPNSATPQQQPTAAPNTDL